MLDTGDSAALTPFRGDFLTYRKVFVPLPDVSKVNYTIGEGMVAWCFKDDSGKEKIIHCQTYHIPTAEIRLWIPQDYFQQEYHAGREEGFGRIGVHDLTLTFNEGDWLVFPYDK